MPQTPPASRRRAILERIDPRVLYSADPVAVIGGPVAAGPVSIAQPATQAVVAVQAQVQHSPRELVVVDATVPDSERLLADLNAQRDQGRALTILTVLPGQDAMSLIDAALTQAPGQWSAIHLVGHGQAGGMTLGDTRIDIDQIRARAEDFAAWSTHLAEGADLLLYGCDLAANDAGRAVVDALVSLTGADVAASVDATGSDLLGGNWTLEYQQGQIGGPTAFSSAIERGWDHLLAADQVIQGGNVITEDNTSYQNSPQNVRMAASNASGRTAAVWLDTSSGSATLRMAVVNADGTVVVAPTTLGMFSGTVRDPTIAIDDAGRIVVAASTESGGVHRVQSILLEADGTTGGRSKVFVDGGGTNIKQTAPSVAFASDGRYVVAYASGSTASNNPSQIRATVYGVGGAELRSAVDITALTGSVQHQAPAVAWLSGDRFVIAYQKGGNSNPYEVYQRVMGVTAVGDAAAAKVGTGTSQELPDVRALASGGFVVVWQSEVFGNSGIRLQTFNAAGAAVSGEIKVSNTTLDTHASVAVGSDGRIRIAWQRDAFLSGNDAVLYREYQPDGTAMAGERSGTQGSGNRQSPTILALPDRVRIVYVDNTSFNVGALTLHDELIAPGIQMSTVGGAVTTEGGGEVTLSLVLTRPPLGAVQVSLTTSRSDEGNPITSIVHFDASNWATAQTVTVRGQNDGVADGNQTYRITAVASSPDPGFNGQTAWVDLINFDNDQAGVSVAALGPLVTDEGGGTLQFAVALSSMPTAPVTVNVSLSDASAASLSTSALVFTASNWETPQIVTLTGLNDFTNGPARSYTVSFAPASSDPIYGSVAIQSEVVTHNPVPNQAPSLALPPPEDVGDGRSFRLVPNGWSDPIVGDPDAGSQILSLTIATDHGVIRLDDGISTVIELPSLALSGTLSEIEAMLRLTTVKLPSGYSGTAQLTYTLTDNGNTGTGGPLSDTALLTVSSVLPPTVTVGAGGAVAVKAERVLTSADLEAVDAVSDPTQLQYTITSVPARGSLQREGINLGVGGHFTQDDVDQGRVSFLASRVGESGVAFGLTVTNAGGASSAAVTLSFDVIGVLPVVVAAADVVVVSGSTHTFSAAALNATHADAASNEISYTVGSASSLGGWRLNGTALATGDQFTQADINAARVSFLAAGAGSGSLSLTVGTPYAPGTSLVTLSVQVTVAPSVDIETFDSDAGHALAITMASLSATHPSATATDIRYEVVTAPTRGELRLNGVLLTAGMSFTQDDVNHLRLTYRSPVSADDTDALVFKVGTAGGPASADQTLPIHIAAAPAPVLIVGSMTITGGDSLTVGAAQLQAGHAYLDAAELRYTLASVQGEGHWTLGGTTLEAGDSFTQADLVAGLVRYTAGTTLTSDALVVRAGTAYGPDTADQTLVITVRVAPTIVTATAFSAEAGFTTTIPSTRLSATHPEASAAQILYEVVTAPTHGQWLFHGDVLAAGDRFTQADINSGQIAYRGGPTPGADSLVFRVGTAGGPWTGIDTLGVTAVAAPAPVLTTAPLGMVAGQSRVIGGEHLSATHPYLAADQLRYQIVSMTGDGRWSRDAATLGVGDSFTQADLNAGRVSVLAGPTSPSGSLIVRVATPYGPASAERTLAITVAVPPLVQVGSLAAEAGHLQILDAATLSATHPTATDERIVYSLTVPPTQGQWLRDGQALGAGAAFTQAELAAGRIAYLCARAGADQISLRVTTPDAVPSAERTLAIRVDTAPAPVLTTTDIATRAGLPVIVDNQALQARHAYLGAADLVYTLVATTGEGQWWLAGHGLAAGDHFTQADVDAGRVSFRGGTIDANASAVLQVGTAFGASGLSQTLAITIEVMPQVQVGALALQADALQRLSTEQLEVSYPEADPRDVVFTLLQLPAQGELRLGGVVLKVGDHFTQADVAAGQVSYQAAGAGGITQLLLSVDRADGGPTRTLDLQIRVAAQTFVAPTPAPTAVTAASASQSSTPSSISSATSTASTSGNGEGSTGAVVAPPTTSRFASRGPEGGGEAAGVVVPVAAAKRGADGTRSDRDGYGSSGEFERLLFQGSGLRQDGYGGGMMAASLTAQGGGDLAAPALRDALDAMSQRLRESAQIDRNLVASTAAVSAGVSIGYVIWMIRGGVLVSSMLASMPAWRSIDPFPVLDRGPQRRAETAEGGEDDSLAGMLDRARRDGLGGGDDLDPAPPASDATPPHGGAAQPSAAP